MMGIIIFVTITIVLVVSIAWLYPKPPKTKGSRTARQRQQDLNDKLATPRHYALSSREQLELRRSKKHAEDVIATNRFAPRSVSHGQPEYDGYSRRDRQHVFVGTAHIKKEDHIEEPAAPKAREDRAGGT